MSGALKPRTERERERGRRTAVDIFSVTVRQSGRLVGLSWLPAAPPACRQGTVAASSLIYEAQPHLPVPLSALHPRPQRSDSAPLMIGWAGGRRRIHGRQDGLTKRIFFATLELPPACLTFSLVAHTAAVADEAIRFHYTLSVTGRFTAAYKHTLIR